MSLLLLLIPGGKFSESSSRRLVESSGQHQTGPRNRNGPNMVMATASSLVLGAINLRKISLIVLLMAILYSSARSPIVKCQDFEDLNNKPANNLDGANSQSAGVFQPSRQFAVQSSSNPQFQSSTTNSRQSLQRPVLSNRFAQQQLSAQASSISNTVVSNQQQTQPTTASQQQQQVTAQTVAASSNIEQIMKNALARTSRLEQSNGNAPENRQDSEHIQSRTGSQAISSSSSSSSASRDRTVNIAESSEAQTGSTQPADDPDKQTTVAQTGTTSGHDTVYSDQRFANLFARRNNQKKSKFMPTEQVKAKPTLPSFIKSPPDPKQFNANSADGQDRPITQASANLISVRLQQQQSNQNRQSVSSQKKTNAAITSNTAANANNKRLNSQKQVAAVAAPKVSSASRATGSQTTAGAANKPVSNNPFNKSQHNSNDPANVIAMARRRLLANNAVQQKPAPN